jgi:hypothetical protein
VDSSPEDLLADLLGELRDADVQLLPWAEVDAENAPAVQAVAYPAVPGAGIPAQVYLRPPGDLGLAITVVRDVQRRLQAEARGEPGVFESYDPVNARKVALIYDLNQKSRTT